MNSGSGRQNSVNGWIGVNRNIIGDRASVQSPDPVRSAVPDSYLYVGKKSLKSRSFSIL